MSPRPRSSCSVAENCESDVRPVVCRERNPAPLLSRSSSSSSSLPSSFLLAEDDDDPPPPPPAAELPCPVASFLATALALARRFWNQICTARRGMSSCSDSCLRIVAVGFGFSAHTLSLVSGGNYFPTLSWPSRVLELTTKSALENLELRPGCPSTVLDLKGIEVLRATVVLKPMTGAIVWMVRIRRRGRR